MRKLDSVEPVENSDKLKPCPFCGGEAENLYINHKTLRHRVFTYMCKQCEALFYLTIKSKYVSAEATEKEIAEIWNRRSDNAEQSKT